VRDKGERVRNWRIISTVAAVVLAALAGVLVWKYVNSADTRAEHNKGFVTALVAKSKIARGMTFDTALADKLFVPVKINRDSLPPDRILPDTDAKLLLLYKGKVAATDIFTGTPVVSDQFVAASQLVNTVAGAIPKGDEAITVSLDPTHAVGGFLTPGDKVNLIVNLTVKDLSNAAGQPEAAKQDLRTTAFLLSGVKVIAVGSSTVLPASPSATNTAGGVTTTTAAPQSQPTSLITLQVTARQAEQIVQATTVGTLYMSLNPPDFKAGQFQNPIEVVEAVNLFDQPLTEVQKVLDSLPAQP
jgi:pilus assembly protein CpaB